MQIELKVKTTTFILILLLITVLFHILEFRAAAWNIDEFIFATGGQKILAGGTLYKDFGDNKPPLIYYTYALFYWIAGKNYLLFYIILKSATIAIVFLIGLSFYCVGKNLGDRTLGMVSGMLFTAYSICAQGSEVLGGRTELYATFMAMVSICFFTRKKFMFTIIDVIFSGIFLSLAALYNTRFGIILAAYLTFIVYKHGVSKRSMCIMTALVASFITLIAAVPLYYYVNGTFEYYTFWQSTVFKHYLNILPMYTRILAGLLVLFFFLGNVPLVVFSLHYTIGKIRENIKLSLASVKKIMNSHSNRFSIASSRLINAFKAIMLHDSGNELFIFNLSLFFFSYAAFFSGGKPGIRYFYMLYIPMCFFAARGFLDLFHYLREKTSSEEIGVLLKTILVLFLISPPGYYFFINYNSRKLMMYESVAEYQQVVEYIKRHVGKNQKIFVWSEIKPIYLYSERVMATSMVYPSEFLTRYYYYTGNFRNETTAWDIFLKQLDAERPELVLDDTGNFLTWHAVFYHENNGYINENIDKLRTFVKKNYIYATKIKGFKIYRKADI